MRAAHTRVSDGQESQKRYRLISDITSFLLSTTDCETLLLKVVQKLVPDLGDWSLVNVSLLDGSTKRFSEARAMGIEKNLILDEIRQRFPVSPQAPAGLGSVIRNGRSELIQDYSKDTALLRRANPHPDYIRLWQRLGIVSYMGVPIRVAGKVYGGLALDSLTPGRYYTSSDLAFLKQIADLLSLAVERALLIRQANESSRQKNEFLTNIRHEIRTPLAAIQGYATLLSSHKCDISSRQQWIESILKSSQHLEHLINDILDLSEVEVEALMIEKSTISMSQIIDDMQAKFEIEAAHKNLVVTWTVQDTVPAAIVTDKRRLYQALINLIGNAIKFTEQGKIEIQVSLTDNQVTNPSALLMIAIADTGIGIKPEQCEKIFDAFTQADGSISRQFGGTGLGLTLAKRIAKLLGGDLVLSQSILNQGSCFQLTLDPGLDTCQETQPEECLHQTAASCEPSIQGLRILLVDDAFDVRTFLEYLLTSRGALVKVASDGQEALMVEQEAEFDLILMDIQMPRLNGFQATHQLRARGCQTPILAVTAHSLSDERQRCLAEGFNEYISKPVKIDTLIPFLAKFLKPSAQKV